MLTTTEIRNRFPALARRHNGHPVAYFDGPGGTQVPREVAEAMTNYLLNHNANTHWVYPTSVETDAMLWAAREAAADLVNATPHDVSLGNNMTTITFHLARGLGRQWGPGDEIVVTELDHHANVAPWHAIARDRGLTVRTARMDPVRGVLDWGHLESLVGPRTRLLAIGAASNALGTINDIPRASRLARSVGALVFVDAVHYAAHGVMDVQAWDCDFLACSPYKFYGPHAGLLYARQDLLDALDVPRLDPAPSRAPERIETGTQNHEAIIGTAAAIDFLAGLTQGVTRRERLVASLGALHHGGDRLVAALWNGLRAIPRVRLYGLEPGEPRTPTVIFTVDGMTSEAVAKALVPNGIFVSNGDFYATTVVERLGHAADGVVRAGCACYTTESEVERLVSAVGALAR